VLLPPLKPDGVVAVHVERVLDLRPVVADLAAASGRSALLSSRPLAPIAWYRAAAWILVSTDRESCDRPRKAVAESSLQARAATVDGSLQQPIDHPVGNNRSAVG